MSKAHLNKSDLHGKLPGEINTRLQHRMGLLKSRDLGRWINGLLVRPQPQLAFLETKSFKKNFTATVKHGSGNVLLWGFSTAPGCSHYQNTSKMHCTLDVLFDGCFQSCPVKHFVTWFKRILINKMNGGLWKGPTQSLGFNPHGNAVVLFSKLKRDPSSRYQLLPFTGKHYIHWCICSLINH